MPKELKNIRDKDKDLTIIFNFLERVAVKLIKVSVDYQTETTITFIDYNDNSEYHVPFDKVNRILDYCYDEYYFKIILSGSEFYTKVKKICIDDLDIEPFIFDLFFRCFFFALKERFYCENQCTPETTKRVFYDILLNAPSDTFDDIPKVDHEYFVKKAKTILKKLEGLNIISYKTNDISGDQRLQSYFVISCDTYKFFISDDYGFESFSSTFEILDLRSYINAQSILNHNLLKKLDKVVHMVILSSFDDKKTKFYNNFDSDNSYIKQFNIARNDLRSKK